MMTRNLITIVLLLFFLPIFSQELYLNSGINFTKYTTPNSQNSVNDLLHSENRLYDDGKSYSVGLIFNKKDSKFSYSVGLNYNQYNLTYAFDKSDTRYSWQTHYIGIQNELLMNIYQSNKNKVPGTLDLKARLGINTAAFVYGNVNGNLGNYSLTSNEDYKKIILQPLAGLTLGYRITELCVLNIGYSVSLNSVAANSQNINYFNSAVLAGVNLDLKNTFKTTK